MGPHFRLQEVRIVGYRCLPKAETNRMRTRSDAILASSRISELRNFWDPICKIWSVHTFSETLLKPQCAALIQSTTGGHRYSELVSTTL